MIDDNIWYLYKDELVGGREVWGMIEKGCVTSSGNFFPIKTPPLKS